MAVRRRFGRIRQLPSGRWQARYPTPDGRLRSAPRTFARRSDAERWLAAVETDLNRGAWRDPKERRVTVAEWATRWLASARPHLKIKTVAGYESLLRTKVLPEFGNLPVASIKPMMVGEWVASLSTQGLSPSRVRQSYRLLSQIMRAAVENDVITVSPCRGVKLPRMPATEPWILDEAEAALLISELPPPHDLLVSLLAYAGLRIGEALALRRCSVELASSTLVVSESLVEIAGLLSFDTPKNHQQRAITLPGFVRDQLAEHMDGMADRSELALLFTTRRSGKPIHYRAWRQTYFDPAAKRAGLGGVTPHDLRASHASWVADRHGILAAADRLGHAHASVTTRHYARTVRGRDALVAGDFDARWREAREGARRGHVEDPKSPSEAWESP
jgi:integrase